MKYISLSDYLKEKYNTKVYKLSLTSGCTCPNRDGTISTGGCIFCSEGGSGDFAADYDRQQRRNAFLKKIQWKEPIEFADVMKLISERLRPMYERYWKK